MNTRFQRVSPSWKAQISNIFRTVASCFCTKWKDVDFYAVQRIQITIFSRQIKKSANPTALYVLHLPVFCDLHFIAGTMVRDIFWYNWYHFSHTQRKICEAVSNNMCDLMLPACALSEKNESLSDEGEVERTVWDSAGLRGRNSKCQ